MKNGKIVILDPRFKHFSEYLYGHKFNDGKLENITEGQANFILLKSKGNIEMIFVEGTEIVNENVTKNVDTKDVVKKEVKRVYKKRNVKKKEK